MSIDEQQKEARAALAALELFVSSEQLAATRRGPPPMVHERERYFREFAGLAIESADAATLQALLDEFRGTGHYFGAYASDQKELNRHLERLYIATGELMVAVRQGTREST